MFPPRQSHVQPHHRRSRPIVQNPDSSLIESSSGSANPSSSGPDSRFGHSLSAMNVYDQAPPDAEKEHAPSLSRYISEPADRVSAQGSDSADLYNEYVHPGLVAELIEADLPASGGVPAIMQEEAPVEELRAPENHGAAIPLPEEEAAIQEADDSFADQGPPPEGWDGRPVPLFSTWKFPKPLNFFDRPLEKSEDDSD